VSRVSRVDPKGTRDPKDRLVVAVAVVILMDITYFSTVGDEFLETITAMSVFNLLLVVQHI
jgi:hypothetical protein